MITGVLRDVPFSVWFLATTPADPSDDVRMIPRVLDNQYFGIGDPAGAGNFDFALDHQASDGGNDPYSDWIYFLLPADRSPGTSGYDQFVVDGWVDLSTAEAHVARVSLMNWNRSQGESISGAGDGPIEALPEAGSIFRIVTMDVQGPPCTMTEYLTGVPDVFTLSFHEPVSGIASLTVRQATSATVSLPAFAPGERYPVTVDGTITNRANAVVEIEAVDGVGNVSVCDLPRMSEVAIHDAGNVVLAMQPNSNFGTFGTGFPTTSGLSAYWPKSGGTSHLFLANLWVAADVGGERRVMDNTYGPNDWSATSGAPITYATTVSNQDIGMTYDDGSAPSTPIGLRVHQQSFQWSDPALDDFVVLKYTFENTGASGDLTGLYPAIWTDTDIGDWTDEVAFDAARGMVYGYDDQGLGGYVGIKVLDGAAHAHAAYVNGQDPHTDAERFDLVVSGAALPGGVADMRMTVTAQPFDLPAGGLHTVVFAMVLGSDLAGLQANADAMEAQYALALVDADADGVPSATESSVPGINGSATGDGNGDGIQDVDQANVASLPNGVDGTYVTFASEPRTTLIGVVATASMPDPETAPAEATFPSGSLLRFA